ncbi:MAG: hypothetical protein QOJ89_3891 [bacterium]|jgi:uncharacterized glyoxalase superfamily protein PhnB
MTAYPVLRYRDARAAIDWLERAFGLECKEAHEGPDGAVVHAELRAGKGLVMLGTDRDSDGLGPRAGVGSVYVAVEDPGALHERAAAAGAEIIRPLVDTDYGSREFSAKDVEGNHWSFGTYAPEP